MDRLPGDWLNLQGLAPARRFVCGYCGVDTASERGWVTQAGPGVEIRICPLCNRPSFFEGEQLQVPGSAPGASVERLPPDVQAVFEEARRCLAASAPTAAVLVLRKLLMHLAVDQGADEGGSFFDYIDYLANKGFVPPHGRGWVDHIRTKGNEANHQIVQMRPLDGEELLTFAEMLLRFIYEFPGRIPPAAGP